MSSTSSPHRISPETDRYVTTDLPLLEILQNSTRKGVPAIDALLQLELCLAGKTLARTAIDAADSVPVKETDPELLLLMLTRWAELSCRLGKPSDAEALVQRALPLISERTHPEIRATVMFVQSTLANTTGNKKKREDILTEITRLLPQHSPRRKFYTWELAMLLARQGRGIEYRDLVKELHWQSNERLPLSRVLFVEFANAVETGAVREASTLGSQIDAGTRLDRTVLPAYMGYRALLQLLHAYSRTSATDSEPPPRRAAPGWVAVVEALLAHETAEALRLARLDAERVLESIFAAGFDSFNLVRAELAAGTPEGALRVLRLREARGNRHYLDDFFIARVENLSGSRKAASDYFASALRSAEEYEATARLDFEIRLSCELSNADVIRMAQAAEKRKTRALRPSSPATRRRENPPPSPAGVDRILGRSKAIRDIREAIQRFAELDAPLLLTGETGTGKDLVARVIHDISSRSRAPFIPVNCASLTETLLESELFGHERGAFTGAERASSGLFEEAGKGTILLDEIGDISPRLQLGLLRVLETGEIRAVGSARSRKINCRIIAATNADLDDHARSERFRTDLLFRLHRLGLHIPPLRERPEDILLLARHFLDIGRPVGTHATMSEDLTDAIRNYDWPGNVRELRNVIERMRLMHSDKLSYDIGDLGLKFHHQDGRVSTAPPAVVSTPAQPEDAGIPPRISRESLRPAPSPDDGVARMLRSGRSQLRRVERLKELFAQHRTLTRGEVTRILEVSPNTATKYLKVLCDEGCIRRIEPSASTRSHYFEISG